MGFAWSSFVAQSTLLACCSKAGLPDGMCLCDERPNPRDAKEAYALATDDVMHFVKAVDHGPGSPMEMSQHSVHAIAKRRMAALDDALIENGVEKHPLKDELAVSDGTCIGVDLCDGTFFTATAPRLALMLTAVLEVFRIGS